tara:strand:- start:374 stop:658 length:285 start_codon:yes stop_codon:yes gene_type:complete
MEAYISIYPTRGTGGEVVVHGYDQPNGKIIQFDGDRHVYFKVPGHKYSFSAHPGMDGYGYSPVSHEVWELTEVRERSTSGPPWITGKATRRLQW